MKYMRNVATIAVNQDQCTGCGACITVCPRNVLAKKDEKVFVSDRDSCIECGACARNCAFDAITGNFGVGCAAAMISGILRYGDPDKGTCDCGSPGESSGCC